MTRRRVRVVGLCFAVVASLSFVVSLVVDRAVAGAASPSCSLSAVEGVPASSLSGSFPFFLSCAALPADVTGLRFEVSAEGSTVEVRAYLDSTSVSATGWGSASANSMMVRVTAAGMDYFGEGDCANGALPANGIYGSQTTATVGVCIDTGNIGGSFPTGAVQSTSGTDVLVNTRTAAVGGTPGSDLQLFTGASFAGASCNSGYTCGTASFVVLPYDSPSPVASWFPSSAFTVGFAFWGSGLVLGLVYRQVSRAL